jgi:hypothetical protein
VSLSGDARRSHRRAFAVRRCVALLLAVLARALVSAIHSYVRLTAAPPLRPAFGGTPEIVREVAWVDRLALAPAAHTRDALASLRRHECEALFSFGHTLVRLGPLVQIALIAPRKDGEVHFA